MSRPQCVGVATQRALLCPVGEVVKTLVPSSSAGGTAAGGQVDDVYNDELRQRNLATLLAESISIALSGDQRGGSGTSAMDAGTAYVGNLWSGPRISRHHRTVCASWTCGDADRPNYFRHCLEVTDLVQSEKGLRARLSSFAEAKSDFTLSLEGLGEEDILRLVEEVSQMRPCEGENEQVLFRLRGLIRLSEVYVQKIRTAGDPRVSIFSRKCHGFVQGKGAKVDCSTRCSECTKYFDRVRSRHREFATWDQRELETVLGPQDLSGPSQATLSSNFVRAKTERLWKTNRNLFSRRPLSRRTRSEAVVTANTGNLFGQVVISKEDDDDEDRDEVLVVVDHDDPAGGSPGEAGPSSLVLHSHHEGALLSPFKCPCCPISSAEFFAIQTFAEHLAEEHRLAFDQALSSYRCLDCHRVCAKFPRNCRGGTNGCRFCCRVFKSGTVANKRASLRQENKVEAEAGIGPFKLSGWINRWKKCFYCDDEFKSINVFIWHLQVEHGDQDLMALARSVAEMDIRKAFFTSGMEAEDSPRLDEEEQTAANDQQQILTDTSNGSGSRKSGQRVLSMRAAGKRKLKSEDLHTDHQCEYCARKFNNYGWLKEHHETYHDDKDIAQSQDSGLVFYANLQKRLKHLRDLVACEVCGKEFTKSYVGRHMALHRGGRTRYCDKCEVSVKVNSWHAHQRVYHNDREYLCDHCGARFLNADSYNYHITTHDKTRRMYECRDCDRKFLKRISLRRHVKKVHEGMSLQRPCPICSRTISEVSMGTHLATHSEEKRYSCNVCGQKAKRSSTIRTHIKNRHDGIGSIQASGLKGRKRSIAGPSHLEDLHREQCANVEEDGLRTAIIMKTDATPSLLEV